MHADMLCVGNVMYDVNEQVHKAWEDYAALKASFLAQQIPSMRLNNGQIELLR